MTPPWKDLVQQRGFQILSFRHVQVSKLCERRPSIFFTHAIAWRGRQQVRTRQLLTFSTIWQVLSTVSTLHFITKPQYPNLRLLLPTVSRTFPSILRNTSLWGFNEGTLSLNHSHSSLPVTILSMSGVLSIFSDTHVSKNAHVNSIWEEKQQCA